MKRYCIKSRPGKSEFFDIISETEEGFKIKLTRISDGDKKVHEDFIARDLFDICIRTGYISELSAGLSAELSSSAA